MLTYSFDDRGDNTLYEHLYKQIKNDIKNKELKPGEKLPSKRALAKHLDISTITVENAYNQLAAEGYIYSVPRSGFYVSEIQVDDFDLNIIDDTISLNANDQAPLTTNEQELNSQSSNLSNISDKYKEYIDIGKRPDYFIDLASNSTLIDNFPFSIWSKLMRETMSNNKEELMTKSPSIGVYRLRAAIAKYLYEFRGMKVEPNQIVVGAGTEYLYGIIIKLLGHERVYGVEDPGYQKLSRIYQANKVKWVHIPLDSEGIDISYLEESEVDVLHITPSHHFPTGIVTPITRRFELLSWASKSRKRYILEDDYDSEFRLIGKPIPSLQSIDTSEKVIYMNTFSKSLTSTIRISYMVLPKSLMEKYNKELSFYSCTVSNFEQYTLAKFIEEGFFEKHINRMRTYYKNIRNAILTSIRHKVSMNRVRIMEENSGLHFLLEVDTSLSDKEIVELAREQGINISCLSQYYYDETHAKKHTLVINYSGLEEDKIDEGVERLFKIFR